MRQILQRTRDIAGIIIGVTASMVIVAMLIPVGIIIAFTERFQRRVQFDYPRETKR